MPNSWEWRGIDWFGSFWVDALTAAIISSLWAIWRLFGTRTSNSVNLVSNLSIIRRRAGYRASNMPRLMKFLTWNRFDCCRQSGTLIFRRRTGNLMRGRAFKVVKFSTKKTVSENGWKFAYVLKSMRESREKIVRSCQSCEKFWRIYMSRKISDNLHLYCLHIE